MIEPGYPDLSLLIEAVSYGAVDLRMPPSGKLEDRKIQRLIEWVEMEAPLPEAVPMAEDEAGRSAGIDLEAGREFWAFQPLSEEEPPPVRKTGWARHPIDRFVLAGLEKQGLEPGPPVDRASLLRRVTFDLIGLPPSPAELKDFLADDSPDAFEEVVDRLLASPHYGERWGRHWLDLRFAETNGHEFDNDKLDAWRYRDYVIRAFNQDVPTINSFGSISLGISCRSSASAWTGPIGNHPSALVFSGLAKSSTVRSTPTCRGPIKWTTSWTC